MRPLFRIAMPVAAAIAVISAASIVEAASFNCSAARTSGKCPEAAICKSSLLSALDDELAKQFNNAVQQAASAFDAEGVRQDQRQWLGERDACDCDVACLQSSYQTRINEFRHGTR